MCIRDSLLTAPSLGRRGAYLRAVLLVAEVWRASGVRQARRDGAVGGAEAVGNAAFRARRVLPASWRRATRA
eukprot:15378394-Alexandrium_andersonii.AAC.1